MERFKCLINFRENCKKLNGWNDLPNFYINLCEIDEEGKHRGAYYTPRTQTVSVVVGTEPEPIEKSIIKLAHEIGHIRTTQVNNYTSKRGFYLPPKNSWERNRLKDKETLENIKKDIESDHNLQHMIKVNIDDLSESDQKKEEKLLKSIKSDDTKFLLAMIYYSKKEEEQAYAYGYELISQINPNLSSEYYIYNKTSADLYNNGLLSKFGVEYTYKLVKELD